MKISQKHWSDKDGWADFQEDAENPQLVLVFGGRKVLEHATHYETVQAFYPDALIVLASTSGEIIDTEVHDDSLSVTAIEFEKSNIATAFTNIASQSSAEAGEALAKQLPKEGLRHLLVFSDGGLVNGTALLEGLNSQLPDNVTITGGLAGDAADFQRTLVGLNAPPEMGNLVAIGLYGEDLKIGFGSIGGWDSFGPDRIITKAEGNVLHELDGQPALDLYKHYLGDQASELPGAALLFPLSIRESASATEEVVRTILTIDEEAKTMTFAGDLPVGNLARLMKANFDRLVDGAQRAATSGLETIGGFEPSLALLVSCVGRKLVLGQRVEDEVEAVRDAIGDEAAIAGFYSYGELAPSLGTINCQLHNQTMTITLLAE